jgi:hypothetical protein
MWRIMKSSCPAMIIGLVLLMACLGVVYAASFIDYFTATPVMGSLSSSCWGAAAVGPRDQSNGLEDRTLTQWCYWDGGIIKGPDGLYHMFASRWNQSAGHNGWFGSVAVHATSSNLYGPYTDQGLVWPNDANGQGHNVLALVMKDGRYAVYCSETRRPTVVYVSSNLNGPWTKLGTVSVTGPSASGFSHSNVYIMLRPDGRYGIISRDALVGVADNILGPYNITGTNIYTQAAGMPTGNVEDPCMWYSGGVYHVVANKWDTRKAYHLTSPDGISNWKLASGYAYDPTANFIRYTNGTVNHWNKLERFNVYMENGHVVAVTFAAIDVAKEQELGNDQHGSKVIVVPFDGASLDSGSPTPTATVTPNPTATVTPIPTPTPVGSYVRFRNAATGLYIDGMGSTSNGANACQWGDSGSANQQWTIINSGGYMMIQNRATGLYLDGMGRTGSGSVCGQWGSSGSANQQWTQEASGSYVRFKNRATGLYLDGMGSTGNGSNLCQWSNSGSANQQWQIQ